MFGGHSFITACQSPMSYGIIAIILLRDDGDLDQVVAVKCEGMCGFLLCLKVEPTRFLNGLNPRYKKKKSRITPKIFGLSQRRNGIASY